MISISKLLSSQTNNIFFNQQPQFQLAGISNIENNNVDSSSIFEDLSIWFAVPKSRISKSRKRMKHQRYKVVHKTNITHCPVTGEVTLMHKLPPNWKKYVDEFGFHSEMVEKK